MPSVSDVLLRVVDLFYRGRIKQIIQATGANDYLGSLYQTVFATAASNTETITVRGATAEITVPDSRIPHLHRFPESDEHEFLGSILEEIDSDDVIADIGAHNGIFASVIADVIPGEDVIAVEPHPTNLEYVKRNAQQNDPDIQIARVALSDAQGEMELGTSGADTGGSTYSLVGEGETVRTDVTTGDQLFDALDRRPTVIKLDVEGAELDAIRGMRETLTNPGFRTLFCEVHLSGGENVSIEDFGGSRDELVDELESMGFEIELLHDRSNAYRTQHIVARSE